MTPAPSPSTTRTRPRIGLWSQELSTSWWGALPGTFGCRAPCDWCKETAAVTASKRQRVRQNRPVNRETFIKPWPEVGLVAVGSPLDPQPSLRIEEGYITEMDGVPSTEFDLIDHFIAQHSIDLEAAPRAMAMPSRESAHMLVDINIPRHEVLKITRGCTAAKLV
ncbi:MAG TPA: hypothetical protein ENL34_11020, partial [Chloroflexi bacterium]|nr:hypothetical protein [Chloroflexota bacterium]